MTWLVLLVPPLCVAYSRLYRGAQFHSDAVGSVVCAGLAIMFAARAILFARLPPQLHDVLDAERQPWISSR